MTRRILQILKPYAPIIDKKQKLFELKGKIDKSTATVRTI